MLINQTTHYIYTDGACSGNPGKGGWGSLIDFPNGKQIQMSGAYMLTTNNRMELIAIIEALKQIPVHSRVVVTTDSQYVVNAIQKKWLAGWQQKGWKNAQKKPVANRDLWETLLVLMDNKDITFKWIRGHTGHSNNELCDKLAVTAYTNGPYMRDNGYGQSNDQPPFVF